MVLGAGGHAAALTDVIEQRNDVLLAVVGRADRPWPVPVLSTDAEALDFAMSRSAGIALGIGDNAARLGPLASPQVVALARALVSPTAHVSASARLAAGVSVLTGAHVGPSVDLAQGVLVNTHAVVEHDVVVGPGSHLAPGSILTGGCVVGSRVLIGAGAVVLPGTVIGDDVVVGAGAVVTRSVPDGWTVVGNPAARSRSQALPSPGVDVSRSAR